jgi:hypothetical protein
MTEIEYLDGLLDRPPFGWFVRDVLPITDERKFEWVAFMIDVDPDGLAYRTCSPREAFVLIPGKHCDRDGAWDALEDMLATRH